MLAQDSARAVPSNHKLEGEGSITNLNVCRGCRVKVSRSSYLQGLVVPAVRPVLLATSAVQQERGPVAVPGLQIAGPIQTHHTQAGLDKGQRIPVSLIWMVDEK